MKRLAQFAAFVFASLPTMVHAASVDLDSSVLNGNSVADFSTVGTLSFDIDFNTATAAMLTVTLEAGDTGLLTWNGLFNNLTGENWTSFDIGFSGGAGLASVGDVNGDFSTAMAGSSGFAGAELLFDFPGEPSGFELGAVPGGLGGVDWMLDVTALEVGESFQLALQPRAVPVPAPFWLFFSALIWLLKSKSEQSAG